MTILEPQCEIRILLSVSTKFALNRELWISPNRRLIRPRGTDRDIGPEDHPRTPDRLIWLNWEIGPGWSQGEAFVVTFYMLDTLNLLRKIRIGTGQTIIIPDERTIREFFIRNPDITLLIPRDLSCLSSIPYSPIITISYDRWGNQTRFY
jgi:hypothetical protein